MLQQHQQLAKTLGALAQVSQVWHQRWGIPWVSPTLRVRIPNAHWHLLKFCNGKTAAYQSQSEIFWNFSYQLHIKPSGRKVEHKSGKNTFFTSSFWYPKKQHSCWYASTRVFLNLKPLQHPGCHMPGWADRTTHHWAPWCRLCLATAKACRSGFQRGAKEKENFHPFFDCLLPAFVLERLGSFEGWIKSSMFTWRAGWFLHFTLNDQIKWNTKAMMGYKLKAQIQQSAKTTRIHICTYLRRLE